MNVLNNITKLVSILFMYYKIKLSYDFVYRNAEIYIENTPHLQLIYIFRASMSLLQNRCISLDTSCISFIIYQKGKHIL